MDVTYFQSENLTRNCLKETQHGTGNYQEVGN